MSLDQKPVPAQPSAGSGDTASGSGGTVTGDGGDAQGTPPVAWDVRQAGPWTHRDLAANGARFHIAELGEGPLVLLVHGWPEYWWAWRHQLAALAEAGYRAVALDLRGIGGSDRTPAATTRATSRWTSPG